MSRLLALVFKYYQHLATTLLTTAIIFAFTNIIIWFALKPSPPLPVKDPKALFEPDGTPNRIRFPRQTEYFDFKAYEGIVSVEYASKVLDGFSELASLGFIYQPWVEFSEPPIKSELVNVDTDEMGFPMRRTISKKSEDKIFVFGDSTTFGYNVSDEHTWPSYLAKQLNYEVRNYGRGNYYPTQEMTLFLDLLRAGEHPRLAIFFDGVNWGLKGKREELHFTKKMEERFVYRQFNPRFLNLPMAQMANRLSEKWAFESKYDYDLEIIAQRFKEARTLAQQIGKLYGVKTIFVLQPDAFRDYPISLYRRKLPDLFYKMRKQRQGFYETIRDSGYVDLSGLFREWGNRKAIVDDCHYSPNFNRFIAQRLAEEIGVK
jgi:hypothetical protein